MNFKEVLESSKLGFHLDRLKSFVVTEEFLEVSSCASMKRIVDPVPQIKAEVQEVIQLGLKTPCLQERFFGPSMGWTGGVKSQVLSHMYNKFETKCHRHPQLWTHTRC